MKNFPLNADDLKQLTKKYPTPFYLYDEKAIRQNIRRLYDAFSWNAGFREYFAVKSTPNPYILTIFKEEHCGVDCSTETELILADSCSFSQEMIMFTSNVTTAAEFQKAKKLGAIINLDDSSHIDYLMNCAGIPMRICCRLNPGGSIQYQGQTILNYDDYKFGFTKEQMMEGFRYLKEAGAESFGIHSQYGSHRREADYFGANARTVFQAAADIGKETGIKPEFINLAGGLGIPYEEEAKEADIYEISRQIQKAYEEILVPAGIAPVPLYLELGIFMTGPYGYFVSTVLHKKSTYKEFLGLDASTNSFMSPCRYTNYHAITVSGKENEPHRACYEITGALCENRDRFASNRTLPVTKPGDILIFHDAGAYSYCHGNNFNGKLRPAELLLHQDGSIQLIRNAEKPENYFATLNYPIRY